MYRDERNYENLQKAMFDGVGEYGIPELQPVQVCDVDNWIGFNFVRGCEEPEKHGVHFFLDDYQFERVWKNPDGYVNRLAQFQAVCTPDFSPYGDFPKVIQIYNHYRKHWCGAYWQMHGLTVIPTITWSNPDSWEWCFDGEPVGGVVALSSQGFFGSATVKDWAYRGYQLMLKCLEPVKIIWRGDVPPELKGDVESGLIHQIPSFVDKWRKTKNLT